MPTDRRTAEEIRREIAGERDQLAAALDDLRRSLRERRRTAGVVGTAGAAGLALATVVAAARRFRRR